MTTTPEPLEPEISLPMASARAVRVLAVGDAGPRIRRVTVGGAALRGFQALPGQDVVVHLTDAAGSGVRRRYTIRNFDPTAATLDLDVVVHGHGPGSSWAVAARPGDDLEIFGPRGKVVVATAGWQLFLGDESALPAAAEMVAALPSTSSAVVLLEVQDAADEQPMMSSAALDLRWLHRGAIPAGEADLLADALKAVQIPAADRHAYVFAESRVVRRLRDELLARALHSGEISAKGYWNLGRSSRD